MKFQCKDGYTKFRDNRNFNPVSLFYRNIVINEDEERTKNLRKDLLKIKALKKSSSIPSIRELEKRSREILNKKESSEECFKKVKEENSQSPQEIIKTYKYFNNYIDDMTQKQLSDNHKFLLSRDDQFNVNEHLIIKNFLKSLNHREFLDVMKTRLKLPHTPCQSLKEYRTYNRIATKDTPLELRDKFHIYANLNNDFKSKSRLLARRKRVKDFYSTNSIINHVNKLKESYSVDKQKENDLKQNANLFKTKSTSFFTPSLTKLTFNKTNYLGKTFNNSNPEIGKNIPYENSYEPPIKQDKKKQLSKEELDDLKRIRNSERIKKSNQSFLERFKNRESDIDNYKLQMTAIKLNFITNHVSGMLIKNEEEIKKKLESY